MSGFHDGRARLSCAGRFPAAAAHSAWLSFAQVPSLDGFDKVGVLLSATLGLVCMCMAAKMMIEFLAFSHVHPLCRIMIAATVFSAGVVTGRASRIDGVAQPMLCIFNKGTLTWAGPCLIPFYAGFVTHVLCRLLAQCSW